MEIEATYRLSTPLFCNGADPAQPELRLPSFKGVLRYWWRALAWSRYEGNLQNVQQEEEKLFGGAATGQSRVSMRLTSKTIAQPPIRREGKVLTATSANQSHPANQKSVGEGARYLGYGVMEAFPSRQKGTEAGQLTRACLLAPLTFTVQLRARDLGGSDPKLLEDALIALGTLGGMGAKSRKGYGSLVLQSLHADGKEQWHTPQSIDELDTAIGKFCSNGKTSALSQYPEFTAFSPKTRHVLLSSDESQPMELLDLVGRELLRYRSWGRHGQLFGGSVNSEKNFKRDHDLMKQVAQSRKDHPRRIAFGLPHNYGSKPDQQVGPHDKGLDRRASPLFIHIHECSEGPVAVLSFLPARFLPSGKSEICVGRKAVSQSPEEELYKPIHHFLDRLLDCENRKEPFTTVKEVKVKEVAVSS